MDINEARVLSTGERLDRVNDGIELIQREDGLTFGTDALLLAGYIEKTAGHALEIGGGTGIISLLLISRGKVSTVDVCEVQPCFADICRRNALINGCSEKMTVHASDIREFDTGATFDTVFSNPPYMKTTSGKSNLTAEKNIARHEVSGGIEDFLLSAKRLLRYGGRFYAVYRPDRLADLIDAMRRAAVEPKRMTFVQADVCAAPSMVLVEGRLGGGVGLTLTRPLIIYSDLAHKCESADMKYIMNNGSFPEDFGIGNKGRKNG